MRPAKWAALVAAGWLALSSLGAAAEPPGPAAPPPSALSAEEIVATRQAAFMLSAGSFGGMRATLERGGAVSTLAFAATGLKRWARAMPSLFPAGTQLANSRAKPEVWSDRAGFVRAAAEYEAAVDALIAAARADDAAAFGARWEDVRKSCQTCHDAYRAPPPAPSSPPRP